ncbi:MAG: DegV family protein [Oscillospiraceae bacterium]
MLSIKPVLHVDDQGHLVNVSKARGRRAALQALVDKMEQTAIQPENQTVFIGHGDCLEDAQWVAQEVRRRFGTKHISIASYLPHHWDTLRPRYAGPVFPGHRPVAIRCQ